MKYILEEFVKVFVRIAQGEIWVLLYKYQNMCFNWLEQWIIKSILKIIFVKKEAKWRDSNLNVKSHFEFIKINEPKAFSLYFLTICIRCHKQVKARYAAVHT